MSDLTDRGREAVEAARAWVQTDTTDAEDRMCEEIGHETAPTDEHLGTFGFACGYLSASDRSWNAAVRAAAEVAMTERAAHRQRGDHVRGDACGYVHTAILSLLRPEPTP